MSEKVSRTFRTLSTLITTGDDRDATTNIIINNSYLDLSSYPSKIIAFARIDLSIRRKLTDIIIIN